MNEITRIEKLKEINNDMVHSYYYLVHARLYNNDRTRYRKIKFINWFEDWEIAEYFERDCYTKDDIRAYNNELGYSVLDIGNYDNYQTLYEVCNDSIKRYNNTFCGAWG